MENQKISFENLSTLYSFNKEKLQSHLRSLRNVSFTILENLTDFTDSWISLACFS